jgi:cob(I)alamin adenosyltransferase
MTCFKPHEYMEGAIIASRLLGDYLTIRHPAIENAPLAGKPNRTKTDEIHQALQEAARVLKNRAYDLVILNDINQLIRQGIVPVEDILELMKEKPEPVELVLSGPGAPDEVLDPADLITEMVCDSPQKNPDKDDEQRSPAPTEVVTGDGKGKTTYCLGKAMLMSCMGIRSNMLQFIKSPKAYGEVRAAGKLPFLELKTMGEGFLKAPGEAPDQKHLDAARRAWEACLREIFSLEYGLIVLDEINIATYFGLINPGRVREMIFLKPQNLHLILSGRNAHEEVLTEATSVIEMKEIRHPLKSGIKARRGIEF